MPGALGGHEYNSRWKRSKGALYTSILWVYVYPVRPKAHKIDVMNADPDGEEAGSIGAPFPLEHRAEKWAPVFSKKRCDNKRLEQRPDSEFGRVALGCRKQDAARASLHVQGCGCPREGGLGRNGARVAIFPPRFKVGKADASLDNV